MHEDPYWSMLPSQPATSSYFPSHTHHAVQLIPKLSSKICVIFGKGEPSWDFGVAHFGTYFPMERMCTIIYKSQKMIQICKYIYICHRFPPSLFFLFGQISCNSWECFGLVNRWDICVENAEVKVHQTKKTSWIPVCGGRGWRWIRMNLSGKDGQIWRWTAAPTNAYK